MQSASAFANGVSQEQSRRLASNDSEIASAAVEFANSSQMDTQAGAIDLHAAERSSLEGPNMCYDFYSRLSVNPLQAYSSNPDSKASGFATCKMCTNGTMRCSTLLFGGSTQLIAAHIHLAMGAETADASKAEGPPVINLCGTNTQGLILDGIDYPQKCQSWDQRGASHNADMPGVLIPGFNRGTTVAQRVKDMARRPERYYFNFHSMASWTHFYPTPHGMSRGQLQLHGNGG